MTFIESVTLEVDDPEAADRFYSTAFGLDSRVRTRASDEPTSGFRSFSLSLIVSQPATAKGFIDAALEAGATSLKPAKKSMWGYGGIVRAPDGTIWQVSTSSKKDTGPATREIDDIVLLLGVDDMVVSKKFYVDQGLEVAKNYGRKYLEFAASNGGVKLALYPRGGLAKLAGVPREGSGSHRIAIDADAGAFTDPDGFTWEPASQNA